MLKKPISLKFLFFIMLVIIVAVWYISIPAKKEEEKRYKDLLETRITENKPNIKINNNKQKKNTAKKLPSLNKPEIQTYSEGEKLTYEELLDKLTEYPITSSHYINNIVNKILEYKGYKPDIINVQVTDNGKYNSKGSQSEAYFDFKTGSLYISKSVINSTDKRVIIAIIIHEIDHFDKLAKVCKYMGIEKFKELFSKNRIPNIDTNFWIKASEMTNIENFNSEYYKEALQRFISQYDIELLSSYSDFYRLSENMRNPLEISAYDESDKVYTHYGMKIEEGPMRKLIKQFNATDWAIYKEIEKYPLLKGERIAIFDYLFAQAIITNFPELKQQFEICTKEKDGDLTNFWLAFEKRYQGFYLENNPDNKTLETMQNLLKTTEELAIKGLSKEQEVLALKYKINTMLNNLVYPDVLENLEKITFNYLKYINENHITDEKQELKCIITLICLQNKLYKNSNNKNITLYYIDIPEQLLTLYQIPNKKKFYLYIYNKNYFKSIQQTQQEGQTLIDLINNNRLNVKIKY